MSAQDGQELPPVEVRADEKGRYRLNLFVGNNYTSHVAAPEGEPYLGMVKTVNWSKGMARQEVKFALARGVWVRGKVTEAADGKPAAGAQIDFWSKGLRLPEGVEHPPAVTTAKDGTFKALLPHGSWHLIVNGASDEYVYQRIPAEKLTDDATILNPPGQGADKAKPAEKPHFYPDAWLAIDVPPNAAPIEVKATLRRLMLQGRLVGPDGKPVGKATIVLQRELPEKVKESTLATEIQRRLVLDLLGQVSTKPVRHHNKPVEVRDGHFEIPMHDLETIHRLLFLDTAGSLGAVADFQGKQAEDGPVTVKLVPCGSATARFVDMDGKPLANYRPLIWTMLPPIHKAGLTDLGDVGEHGPGSGYCEIWNGQADPLHYGAGPVTDTEGRITFRCLVPGANHRISLFDGTARDFIVEPGKTMDLGDVRAVKPEQTKKLPIIKPEP
jgi:protocatechuate 3,4-dioxygenase beta subunit